MSFRFRPIALAALLPVAAPGIAQAQQGNASLNIARIYHDGALARGNTTTFRVTVRNGNQRVATPSGEAVRIVLAVLDPAGKRVEYEGKIATGIGPNGSQTGAIADVSTPVEGTYTMIAWAELPPKTGRAPIRAADRTETFTVGAPAVAGQFDLNVVITDSRGVRANGLRVTLSTYDGQELAWKNSAGNGEARFPKLAPSPAGKPYVIEVRRGVQVLAREQYLMPAQTSAFDVKLATP